MNIAKKLLFALLLCGATFTVACDEETNDVVGTAAKGAECVKDSTDAAKVCKSGLTCKVSSGTKGKCEEAPAQTVVGKAAKGAKCVKDSTDAEKVCKSGLTCKIASGTEGTCEESAAPAPADKAALGEDCSSKECADGLACVTHSSSSICSLKCTADTDCDATKAGADNTKCQEVPKKGSTTDKEKVCGPGASPAPVVGEAGAGAECKTDSTDAKKKCKDGYACVDTGAKPQGHGMICAFKCTNDTGCSDSTKTGLPGAGACVELPKEGSTDKEKVCSMAAPAPALAQYGEECNKKPETDPDAKRCGTDLLCVSDADNAETGKCKRKCDDNAPITGCTTENGGENCVSVDAAKIVSEPVATAGEHVCGA